VTRIAISGASGFVGGHLCRWLSERDLEPMAIPRPALTDDGLIEALRGAQCVVHLAARAHRLSNDIPNTGEEFHASNVELTRRLALASRVAGVRRLVFVSSAGVLGNASPPAGFTDDSHPAPHDDYTRSKLAAEQALLDEFQNDLEVVILRPPLVYGPGAPGNFRRILRAASSGWPLPVGRLTAPRSMISVRNLCDALTQAAVSDRLAGKPMLVADHEVTSVADLVQSIAASVGSRPLIIGIPSSIFAFSLKMVGRASDSHRLLQPFVVKGELARQALEWSPPYRLADELDWTVRMSGVAG